MWVSTSHTVCCYSSLRLIPGETRTLQGLFLCSFFSDNNEGSSSSNQPIFAMAGDGTSSDVKIPAVLLFFEEGQILRRAVIALEDTNRSLRVRLAAKASGQGWYNRVLKWWRHKKEFIFWTSGLLSIVRKNLSEKNPHAKYRLFIGLNNWDMGFWSVNLSILNSLI